MKFAVEIECDSDAFHPSPFFQLSCIMERLMHRMDAERDEDFTILDINGNTVGSAKFSA